MAAGLICSLLVPQMHLDFSAALRAWPLRGAGLVDSFLGLAVGAGPHLWHLARWENYFWAAKSGACRPPPGFVFTETSVQLPGEEIPYEDLFYRKGDAIELQARRVELMDRCYANIAVRLTADCLSIGGELRAGRLSVEAGPTASSCRAK